jgi:glutamate--cysteine ligase
MPDTVPHLTTATREPLHMIESHLLDRQPQIEAWFRDAWRTSPAPFYASVDLRNAGFKLAPVDTNLFPAGFNNLNVVFEPACVLAVQSAMERFCPMARGLILIPESHTRNLFYLESLVGLHDLIIKAGYAVRIGSLMPDLTEPRKIHLPSGRELLLEPLQRRGQKLYIGDYEPCAILLNNDLSGGIPPILENLDQPIIPPLALGWQKRLKSGHFAIYKDIAAEFSEIIDIDPWLIDPLFRNCGQINFMTHEGEECLVSHARDLLEAIQKKYDEYKIDKQPFLIVKADAGTYGMAIMTVTHPEQLANLNRKQRTRMSSLKEGRDVDQVIVQEGVYTFETWGNEGDVAEPVVYMIDHFVVGGFYRVHTERGPDENLNSPGMSFKPLAFARSCVTPEHCQSPDAEPNRFYAYGVIARLALLAAAREIAAESTP